MRLSYIVKIIIEMGIGDSLARVLTNKHSIGSADCLEYTSNDADSAPNGNGGTTSKIISTVGSEWKSTDRASRHDSVQKTELRWIWVIECCVKLVSICFGRI